MKARQDTKCFSQYNWNTAADFRKYGMSDKDGQKSR